MSKSIKDKNKIEEKPLLFVPREPLAVEKQNPELLLKALESNIEKKMDDYFPIERREQISKNFYVFDRNGDDLLTKDELVELMISVNADVSDPQVINDLYVLLEKENEELNSKGVTLDDVLIVMSKELKDKDVQSILMAAFAGLDPESLGYIDSERMKELLMYKGYNYNEEQIDVFMKEADPKGEGKIYYHDLILKLASRNVPKKKIKPPK